MSQGREVGAGRRSGEHGGARNFQSLAQGHHPRTQGSLGEHYWKVLGGKDRLILHGPFPGPRRPVGCSLGLRAEQRSD